MPSCPRTELALTSRSPESAAAPPLSKESNSATSTQNAHRSVRRPKQSRLHPVALIEDEESIQYALMEVINALMKNTIDLKRATLILRALHIAVKNANRVKFEVQGMHAVTRIPDFALPPDNADFDETTEIDLPYNAWVPQKTERQVMEEKARAQKLEAWQAQQAQIRSDLERARITPPPETAHVATAASAVQAKPQPSASVGADAACPEQSRRVRPAPPSGAKGSVPAAESPTAANPVPTPNPIPPHNFKPPQPTPATPPPTTRTTVPARKPPQPAAAARKERKSATQPARHG